MDKFHPLETVAARLERAALFSTVPEKRPDNFPLPATTWNTLVRSRRMRVLDWIISAGFRLLNLMPDLGESFLAFAQQDDLDDKYAVPGKFWQYLQGKRQEENRWMDATARTEILLVEMRDPRPTPASPAVDGDLVTLARGMRLERLDPFTLELHESLPAHSLPAAKATMQLARFLSSLPPAPPVASDVLILPPCDETGEGTMVQIDHRITATLEILARQPMSCGTLRRRFDPEEWRFLLQAKAFEVCQSR